MIVHLRHLRARGHCSRGARDFFAQNGLNWNEFIKNGLPEEVLLSTNNEMARQVVEAAWAEAKNKQ